MPEYTFTGEWHSPRLDAASLNSIYDQIRSNPDAGQPLADTLECFQYVPPSARQRSAYPGVRDRRPGPRNLQGLLLSCSLSPS